MAFSPLDYTPKLWLNAGTGVLNDSDAAATDGQNVKRWTDLSGNNYHADYVAGNRVVYKTAIVNGLPVCRWASSARELKTPAVTYGLFTIYAVFQQSGQYGFLFERSVQASANNGEWLNLNSSHFLVRRSGSYSLQNGWTYNANTWKLGVWAYGGTNSTANEWISGTMQALTVSTAVDPGATEPADNLYVGGRSGGGTNLVLTGDLAELIVYPAYHTLPQRLTVTGYLGSKYGITLADRPAIQVPAMSGGM